MIDINCDVGEGVNNEHLLMPYLSSCSIACGGHAGDLSTMKQVVDLAILHKVDIGAHPSYPDKANFGRVSFKMDKSDLINSIRHQVYSLKEIVEQKGGQLHHIKAHGALYNDIVHDEELSNLFIEAIADFMPIKVYTPYQSTIANREELEIVYEAFADRHYNEDLTLVSRSNKKAVITDVQEIIEHVDHMLSKSEIITITGKPIPIKVNTFCVHSDSPNAVNIIKAIHEHFSD